MLWQFIKLKNYRRHIQQNRTTHTQQNISGYVHEEKTELAEGELYTQQRLKAIQKEDYPINS